MNRTKSSDDTLLPTVIFSATTVSNATTVHSGCLCVWSRDTWKDAALWGDVKCLSNWPAPKSWVSSCVKVNAALLLPLAKSYTVRSDLEQVTAESSSSLRCSHNRRKKEIKGLGDLKKKCFTCPKMQLHDMPNEICLNINAILRNNHYRI